MTEEQLPPEEIEQAEITQEETIKEERPKLGRPKSPPGVVNKTPRRNPERIRVLAETKRATRWGNQDMLNEMFAAYYAGKPYQEICEMFDVPSKTYYRLRDVHGWVEKKKRLDILSKEHYENDLIKKKVEKIKMADTIISIVGASIIKSYKEGTLQVKIQDFLSSVKAHDLITGESHSQTNINITNQVPVQTKEMLEEMVQNMTPEERGMVLEIEKKIIRMTNEADREKIKLLDNLGQ